MKIPKLVLIIPYRDREPHYIFFTKYMPFILEDYNNDDYEFCFVHQHDERPFNRGALKNIGFMYYRDKYPDNYKDIQFIFHDIDTIPYTKELWNYETKKGIVKHFYGYKHALGGILTIFGEDFEKINGFPCFWSWGFEDNVLQKRVLSNNMEIDRSEFYDIQSKEVLHFFDGYERNISIENINRTKNCSKNDGITSLKEISFSIDSENMMIHVYGFNTLINSKNDHYVDYNIKNGNHINKNNLVKLYNNNNVKKIREFEKLMFTNTSSLKMSKITKKSK